MTETATETPSATRAQAPQATPVDTIAPTVERLRARFDSDATRELSWRRDQLRGLMAMVDENEARIVEALGADLGKPPLEAAMAEVRFTRSEAAAALDQLGRWTRPEHVGETLMTWPGRSAIVREPFGVALIIAPWNYPFTLVMSPLIGALAAGNCVLVKPSEVSAHTSAVLADLLPKYLDSEAVAVVEGGVAETTEVLRQRFDHIFYTGNGVVARIVMRAAAEHLTPITLELGGKSPCIVDGTAKLEQAARRICWGKYYNAGQTCVAPDYILATRDVHDQLIERLAATLRTFYGEDAKASADYGRIINERHHRRLVELLEGQTVVCGGDHDEATRYIAPTVLSGVDPASAVMQEEIFGPILPVLAVDDVDAAIEFVRARPKPLALYLFSKDRSAQERVLRRTSSGGAVLNHVWLHLANSALPFGGVGESGMGASHGRHGFETFSHRKAVLDKATWIDPWLMYPPYTEFKRSCLAKLL